MILHKINHNTDFKPLKKETIHLPTEQVGEGQGIFNIPTKYSILHKLLSKHRVDLVNNSDKYYQFSNDRRPSKVANFLKPSNPKLPVKIVYCGKQSFKERHKNKETPRKINGGIEAVVTVDLSFEDVQSDGFYHKLFDHVLVNQVRIVLS